MEGRSSHNLAKAITLKKTSRLTNHSRYMISLFVDISTMYCITRWHQIPKLINYVAAPSNLPSLVCAREMGAAAKKNFTEKLMVYSIDLHINTKLIRN